ncbi:flagellar basal body-associated FliL family protein [Rhodobacter sp. KR11]|jgi:flagellar FliL protein|uniref:flagellar basal body-associated FliL family protein n=1 Tax=Rhodobacter sp. KR11 TaxID=2974588 RepID=UPI0022234A7F|nr:flagellar basal body-associated FliL family protein [Rhodobacter sp. KR11]MCW1919182.1 flagellar basal body-associated FliL family protein [Rhodobacter sp. KR11]
MVKKLIPVILGIIGLLIGAGAGFFLRPAPEPAAEGEAAAADAHAAETPAEGEAVVLPEFAKLQNQFVVPVMEGGKISAMVILSFSLEVETGASVEVYAVEPKLRDMFLQVLFDHANAGGFAGVYTDGANLVILREALLEAAKSVLGEKVKDVLITDLVRQDS